jgi:hypothetical protein
MQNMKQNMTVSIGNRILQSNPAVMAVTTIMAWLRDLDSAYLARRRAVRAAKYERDVAIMAKVAAHRQEMAALEQAAKAKKNHRSQAQFIAAACSARYEASLMQDAIVESVHYLRYLRSLNQA